MPCTNAAWLEEELLRLLDDEDTIMLLLEELLTSELELLDELDELDELDDDTAEDELERV